MHGEYFLQLLLCCLIMGATLCTATMPELLAGQSQLESAIRKMIAKDILDYNATCSFEDETRRLAVVKKMANMIYDLNFEQFPTMASEYDDMVTNSTGNFCNALENLQCSSSGFCECAHGDITLGVDFKSIYENKVCRITLGSGCAPESSKHNQILMRNGVVKRHMDCQRNSKCIMNHDKRTSCTESEFHGYLVKTYGGDQRVKDDLKGFMHHSKNKLADGICTCIGGFNGGRGNAAAAAQNVSPAMTSMLGALFGILYCS